MADTDATALAIETALDDWSDLHCHRGWATDAAWAVVASLRGRSGFDGAFDSLDDDLVEEVVDDIETTVGAAYRRREYDLRVRRVELVDEILRVTGDKAREYQRHAGELGDKLDATETELGRLRDVFLVMSRRGFGLDQNATSEEQAEYWYRQTEKLRWQARYALGSTP